MSRMIRSRRAAPAHDLPLYARLLGLRQLAPSGFLCFVFLEGTVALGVLLALAELVSWWGVLVLPLTVAGMVKLNDIIAGVLSRPATASSSGGPGGERPLVRPAVAASAPAPAHSEFAMDDLSLSRARTVDLRSLGPSFPGLAEGDGADRLRSGTTPGQRSVIRRDVWPGNLLDDPGDQTGPGVGLGSGWLGGASDSGETRGERAWPGDLLGPPGGPAELPIQPVGPGGAGRGRGRPGEPAEPSPEHGRPEEQPGGPIGAFWDLSRSDDRRGFGDLPGDRRGFGDLPGERRGSGDLPGERRGSGEVRRERGLSGEAPADRGHPGESNITTVPDPASPNEAAHVWADDPETTRRRARQSAARRYE